MKQRLRSGDAVAGGKSSVSRPTAAGDDRIVGRGRALFVLVILGVGAYAFGLSFFATGWEAGPNYRNVSIDTHVNITGSAPIPATLYLVTPQVLSAGVSTTVSCNVSVRDYNGFSDIIAVNATLFHSSSSLFASDDNNTHYTNSSCVGLAGEEGGFFKNYTCSFPVQYYARNGTWNCTVFANDSIGLVGNGTGAFNMSALYALNVSETLIEYGNLSAGEYSPNISVNVSNLGNLNINISVLGYGVTAGDGLAFKCDIGNLTVGTQRFTSNISANYTSKTALTGSYQQIPALTVNKTTTSAGSQNTTFWQLYVDPAQPAYGNCNGTIVFQAGAS